MAEDTRAASQLRRRTGILERLKSHSGNGIHSPILNDDKESVSGSSANASLSPAGRRVSSMSEEVSDSEESGENGGEEEEQEETEGLHDDAEAEKSAREYDVFDRPLPKAAKAASKLADATMPHTRAWWEFDVAVVAALISPIGNWLTGGDHIKNLLLILFMIFYLHQIIEVPWTLYQQARARRRAVPTSSDQPLPDEHTRRLAASQLRSLELIFLAATSLSPFLGATLLHWVFGSLDSGSQTRSLSWFSTGLFVLSTGIRPWSHLVERLSQRTVDLHDAIHYPASSRDNDAQAELEKVQERMAQLEKDLKRIRASVAESAHVQELYDHVDEVVEGVEKRMRRQERKTEAARVSQESQIAALEATITARKEKDFSPLHHDGAAIRGPPSQPILITDWLSNVLAPFWPLSQNSSKSRPKSLLRRPSHLRSKQTSFRLETIPENGIDTIAPISPSPPKLRLETSIDPDSEEFAPLVPPTSNVVLRCYYLATLPFRLTLRFLFTAHRYIIRSVSF